MIRHLKNDYEIGLHLHYSKTHRDEKQFKAYDNKRMNRNTLT